MTAAGGWCAPEGTPGTATLADAIAVTAGEPQALRSGIRYPSPEPIEFPAPRDPMTADRIEDTAQQLLDAYPYRTLLDCRELAARIVDEILCWDAGWPEAEGDCGCAQRGVPDHQPDCLWSGEEAML